MSKENKPMSKKQFVTLLKDVLRERKNKNKYVKPYDELYNKCMIGYELTKKETIREQNQKIFIKLEEDSDNDIDNIEASSHLTYVLESLIKSFGKEAVVSALRKL